MGRHVDSVNAAAAVNTVTRALMHPVYSVGHSIRSVGELIALLKDSRIELVADVRRYPASRRNPQFSSAPLAGELRAADVDYVSMTALGGRRTPHKNSNNTAWRNASFRGYADYMETDQFAAAIAQLLAHASQKRTAMMCAERAWQQCHRGLIADFLKARGVEVLHILWDGRIEPHPFTAAARIVDGALSYRASTESGQSGCLF